MPKQINVLQALNLYSKPEEEAKTSYVLKAGDIVDFNREKNRNDINWLEIFINRRKYYIKNDISKISVLKDIKILDESCTVVFYKLKKDYSYTFNDVFTVHKFDDRDQDFIQVRRYFDFGKEQSKVLFYDKNLIEVSKSILAKGEKTKIISKQGDFIEILYGRKKGYILKDVAYYEIKDWWMFVVIILVFIAVWGGSLFALIETGISVSGGILAIPAAIIAAILIFLLKLIFTFIDFVFQSFRKMF